MTPVVLDVGFQIEAVLRGEGNAVFVVCKRLASGANSQTYLVRRLGSGEFAVLKAARWREQPDTDLKIAEKLLVQFEHPNVTPLLGTAWLLERRALITPRYFDNPLLVLSRPDVRANFPDDPGTRYYPLPACIGLPLALDLIQGIQHLHRRGFVHHDIKPTNLMVHVPWDEAKLADHELLEAALRGDTRGVLIDVGGSRSKAYLHDLSTGKVDGDLSVIVPQLSPLYAPPEALIPRETEWGLRPHLHPSLDLYAAAMVIYAFVSGRGAYDHLNLDHQDMEGLLEVKRQEADGLLFPFSAEAVQGAAAYRPVANDLVAFLGACTHRDPGQRPTALKASEFFERLVVRLKGVPERRRSTTRQRRTAEPFLGVTTEERAQISGRTHIDRRTWTGPKPQ